MKLLALAVIAAVALASPASGADYCLTGQTVQPITSVVHVPHTSGVQAVSAPILAFGSTFCGYPVSDGAVLDVSLACLAVSDPGARSVTVHALFRAASSAFFLGTGDQNQNTGTGSLAGVNIALSASGLNVAASFSGKAGKEIDWVCGAVTWQYTQPYPMEFWAP